MGSMGGKTVILHHGLQEDRRSTKKCLKGFCGEHQALAEEEEPKQVDTMALQMPSTSRMQITSSHPTITPLAPPPGTNVGLRRPSDRFALRSSFFSPSVQLLVSHPQQPQTQTAAPRFSMRVASKQAYICRDCGYIYNDKSPFEKLPDKYYCPVCGAPKRRFKAYTPAVSKNANAMDVRKARKEELKRDEAVGQFLPTAIAIGVIFLAGLYFYLNSTF